MKILTILFCIYIFIMIFNIYDTLQNILAELQIRNSDLYK